MYWYQIQGTVLIDYRGGKVELWRTHAGRVFSHQRWPSWESFAQDQKQKQGVNAPSAELDVSAPIHKDDNRAVTYAYESAGHNQLQKDWEMARKSATETGLLYNRRWLWQ